MPLNKGTINVARLAITDSTVPEAYAASWVEKALKYNEDNPGSTESKKQWCVFGNELSKDLKATNVTYGQYVALSVMLEQKTIDKKLLKLQLNKIVQERLGNDQPVSRKERKEITEQLVEDLLLEASPTLKTIQIIIDPSNKTVYVGDISSKSIEIIFGMIDLTYDLDLKEISFIKAAVNENQDLLAKIIDEKHSNLSTTFAEDYDIDLGFSSMFLTWLWYRACSGDSEWEIDNTAFGLVIENSISLDGSVIEPRQTILKKNLSKSMGEVKLALANGKLVSLMKLTLASGDTENETCWSCTLFSDEYFLKRLKVPKPSEKDSTSRLISRISSMIETFDKLDFLVKEFASVRYGATWNNVLSEMRLFIQ